MKKETLVKGLLLLTQAFPGVDFSVNIYWEILSPLDDESFKRAIFEFIRTRKEIYPGTGPVAILYDRTMEFYKQKMDRNDRKITDDRCDPPPPEWHEAMKKIRSRV